ncbi:hypothetical protein EIP91_005397 [Steccherinum ochraceum]|uniref:Uncharacterized protein n=1 Tax=Steccherinum ochraceum TaxID=92696 RepID=A0A4R0R9R8_9APHY|nr:hypothetical protein EIP91_005397 [Steccherinum ochraceum]
MTQVGESKHSQEMAELNRQHEVRHTKLERLALLLMTWLLAMVAVLIYLLVRGHPPHLPTSRWNTPLHFTIPVLSPFTSVTEHEESVLSTRTMVIMILAGTCLAYACFTYWLRQQKR